LITTYIMYQDNHGSIKKWEKYGENLFSLHVNECIIYSINQYSVAAHQGWRADQY